MWALLIAAASTAFSACSKEDNVSYNPSDPEEETPVVSDTVAPAFPGAEGHGRYITGGRGGEVRHVTNLNDSGEGSLRSAVNGSKAKIVVFDVSGVISLNSDLVIGANTTIEGQTAPAPGVTVRHRRQQHYPLHPFPSRRGKRCQRWCRCHLAAPEGRHRTRPLFLLLEYRRDCIVLRQPALHHAVVYPGRGPGQSRTQQG